MAELVIARKQTKESTVALANVMRALRRAARWGGRADSDGILRGGDGKYDGGYEDGDGYDQDEAGHDALSVEEQAAMMVDMVTELAADRDCALEALATLSPIPASSLAASSPGTGLNVRTAKAADTAAVHSADRGVHVTNSDWAQTASAPPPSVRPNPAVDPELAREACRADTEYAEAEASDVAHAEAVAAGGTPFNLTRVLDALVVTPWAAAHAHASTHGSESEGRGGHSRPRRAAGWERSTTTDEMDGVLHRVAGIARGMAANPDTDGGGGSGEADGNGDDDARLHDMLNLVQQLDAARRSAEDAAFAAREDVTAMRAEVAVAWEALATPHATPTQSSVERFAEELQSLLFEKDEMTAVAAREAEHKRRAVVSAAEANRQLIIHTGARTRAEAALRSAHEQVEGLKRHARELADLNQTSRQQAAAERSRAQRLQKERDIACDREEKERRRADSLHAEAQQLRSGLTARTREAARHGEAAREARVEVEQERSVHRTLRVREQLLEGKVLELVSAIARQAHVVSKPSANTSQAKTLQVPLESSACTMCGLAVRELEVLVQELALEEIRARARAAAAEAEAATASGATADALQEVAQLRAKISAMDGRNAEGSSNLLMIERSTPPVDVVSPDKGKGQPVYV